MPKANSKRSARIAAAAARVNPYNPGVNVDLPETAVPVVAPSGPDALSVVLAATSTAPLAPAIVVSDAAEKPAPSAFLARNASTAVAMRYPFDKQSPRDEAFAAFYHSVAAGAGSVTLAALLAAKPTTGRFAAAGNVNSFPPTDAGVRERFVKAGLAAHADNGHSLAFTDAGRAFLATCGASVKRCQRVPSLAPKA